MVKVIRNKYMKDISHSRPRPFENWSMQNYRRHWLCLCYLNSKKNWSSGLQPSGESMNICYVLSFYEWTDKNNTVQTNVFEIYGKSDIFTLYSSGNRPFSATWTCIEDVWQLWAFFTRTLCDLRYVTRICL